MKLSKLTLSLFVLVSGCAASQTLGTGTNHSDLPEADSYWVPKGVEVTGIIAAAQACGARVDGGMYHHITIPPGFANHGFHFVGKNTHDAMICTVDRLGAVLAFQGRSRTAASR